jgi:hypothetical protein
MNTIEKITNSKRYARCVETMEPACRPATHARRAPHVHMSRAEFIGLVAGWSGGLVVVLFISALARHAS